MTDLTKLQPLDSTRALAAEMGQEPAAHRRPRLHVCGLSHTRAPLQLRECYALPPEACSDLVRRLVRGGSAEQALVLSTCNRTELYAFSAQPRFAAELRRIFLNLGQPLAEEFAGEPGPPPIYEYQGVEAVRHLFAVGAGLDSMILGENQIKQQLHQAWTLSREAGGAGSDLHRLMEAALRSGKRIRTETDLNLGTLCVAKAAVLRGEQALGSLRGRTCLVIGAGKVGRIAARAILERGPARLWIVNRTAERARAIADELAGAAESGGGDGDALPGAEAYGLEALPCLLPEAEFIIGAAYSPELVIDADLFEQARGGRAVPGRVCLVDAAVPRILDPALAGLPGVELWDIEHMQEVIEENRRRRTGAARQAWAIVEDEVGKYQAALQSAELAPVIRQLRERIEGIFAEEEAGLEANLEPAALTRLRATHHRIKQRVLHEAIVELKKMNDVEG